MTNNLITRNQLQEIPFGQFTLVNRLVNSVHDSTQFKAQVLIKSKQILHVTIAI